MAVNLEVEQQSSSKLTKKLVLGATGLSLTWILATGLVSNSRFEYFLPKSSTRVSDEARIPCADSPTMSVAGKLAYDRMRSIGWNQGRTFITTVSSTNDYCMGELYVNLPDLILSSSR